ncbi:MAG: prepilin peptidase, partial [Acidaminococcaceae bacterium]
MYLLIAAYFVIGLVVGSFLNVCIYRLPEGKSIISPPSSCGNCGHRLYGLDMIPVLSYFLLGGKCRYCSTPYSPRYAFVELLTGFLFVLCGFYYLPGIELALVFLFAACLVVLTFVDFEHQIILDEVLIVMLAGGAAYVYFSHGDYWDALYGMGVAGGLMLLIFILSRGGMGAGDVKLSFVLGLWLGLKAAIVCLMLAFVLGGFIGVFLLATGIKQRKDPIPFGPFLCLGAVISLLYSPY